MQKYILKALLTGKLRFREVATILGFRSGVHGRKYFVSDKLKVVYIPVSKSGNSSVKKMLLKAEGIAESELSSKDSPYFIHSNKNLKSYTRKAWDKKWDDYFVFTVVRDPVIRYMSAHYNKFRDTEKNNHRGFIYHHYLGGMLTPDMSALDVLKKIVHTPNKLTEEHFAPQHYWITEHHKCSPHIYQLEDLNVLINALNEHGLDIKKVEKLNVSKFNHVKDLSPELLDLIAEKYVQDFEHYDYNLSDYR